MVLGTWGQQGGGRLSGRNSKQEGERSQGKGPGLFQLHSTQDVPQSFLSHTKACDGPSECTTPLLAVVFRK